MTCVVLSGRPRSGDRKALKSTIENVWRARGESELRLAPQAVLSSLHRDTCGTIRFPNIRMHSL